MPAPKPLLFMGQPADTVFDNDDGTVHNDPEVQRTQAHQVGADMVGHHAAKGEQHGERDDKRSNERCPQVAEEQEQHHNHQHCAFEQIGATVSDGFVHQDGAVINCAGGHPGGKVRLISSSLLGDGLDTARLFSPISMGRCPAPLLCRSAWRPRFAAPADGHVGDILDAYRYALALCRHDLRSRPGLLPGREPNQILLAAFFDIAGARHWGCCAPERARTT